jgi:hypothetical protein
MKWINHTIIAGSISAATDPALVPKAEDLPGKWFKQGEVIIAYVVRLRSPRERRRSPRIASA